MVGLYVTVAQFRGSNPRSRVALGVVIGGLTKFYGPLPGRTGCQFENTVVARDLWADQVSRKEAAAHACPTHGNLLRIRPNRRYMSCGVAECLEKCLRLIGTSPWGQRLTYTEWEVCATCIVEAEFLPCLLPFKSRVMLSVQGGHQQRGRGSGKKIKSRCVPIDKTQITCTSKFIVVG